MAGGEGGERENLEGGSKAEGAPSGRGKEDGGEGGGGQQNRTQGKEEGEART